MNLDELRSVQSKERQKDSLQNLRPSFYQEVGEYIADLEDERERVAGQVDDPFSSPEVGRLTDEIETAKDVVEAIYERRMGKLVKQASLAAAGMAADDDGLTAEEADLFDDLVDRIQSNKTRVLDVLEGVDVEPDTSADAGAGAGGTDSSAVDAAGPADRPTDPTRADDGPPTPPEPAADTDPTEIDPVGDDQPPSSESGSVTPADVMGGDGPTVDETGAGSDDHGSDSLERERAGDGSDTGAESEPGDDATATVDAGDADAAVDRVTVRITRDVGSILGVDDREYTLSSDDVVTLPEQNASPLLERDAAEQLE
ncbi:MULTISPECIES: DNA replication complex subunit Gins51 [Natrialbaceae]|uniref:DNA replication complex subunit Gins51 n=1 Tax=Natrialbaceae TaxID=1644061 RepID=UPI00207D23D7|nr:hypothetical protein [Natronococcus sp. CG52]